MLSKTRSCTSSCRLDFVQWLLCTKICCYFISFIFDTAYCKTKINMKFLCFQFYWLFFWSNVLFLLNKCTFHIYVVPIDLCKDCNNCEKVRMRAWVFYTFQNDSANFCFIMLFFYLHFCYVIIVAEGEWFWRCFEVAGFDLCRNWCCMVVNVEVVISRWMLYTYRFRVGFFENVARSMLNFIF